MGVAGGDVARLVGLLVLYLGAIVAANRAVTVAGAWMAPVVAFGLIPIDLVVRDALHERWRHRHLALHMGLLIVAGGALSLLVAAPQVALASSVAFMCAATADTVVYAHILNRGGTRARARLRSNVVSSGVDSLVFVGLAFGLLPAVIATGWAAKVGGCVLWQGIIFREWVWRSAHR